MLKKGNSLATNCLINLFSLSAGEVYIDQCRGLRADIQDAPATTAYALLQASAYWVASNYEPRVSSEGLSISADDILGNNYTLRINTQ